MRTRLLHWLDNLRTSFWFVPSLMLLSAAVLAMLLLRVDLRVDPGLRSSLSWAYSGGPEGARSLLSTIAGSMITAASVTFSLASVALSIASQQYGSRVLRNFMRDRITQVLLGTFVSTFLYCVLVVRSIRGSEYSGFVPSVSITAGLVLALLSLLMLIYFIHHVSRSIQASTIIGVIADEISREVVRLYPRAAGSAAGPLTPPLFQQRMHRTTLEPECGGYLVSVDTATLLKLAADADLIVRLLLCPGDHFLAGQQAAEVWSHTALPAALHDKLNRTLMFGRQRSPEQDIRYPFQQLTDVIARALSPGINDPFTAMNGVDALSAAAVQVAGRPRVDPWRRDKKGTVRLFAPTVGLEQLLQETVGHIALYAAADSFVMDRLHRLLNLVEPHLMSDTERETVRMLRADLTRRQMEQAKA